MAEAILEVAEAVVDAEDIDKFYNFGLMMTIKKILFLSVIGLMIWSCNPKPSDSDLLRNLTVVTDFDTTSANYFSLASTFTLPSRFPSVTLMDQVPQIHFGHLRAQAILSTSLQQQSTIN
ncbi:MAG: hypothetical protein QM734_07245 [Cyclobacteriaceae bacterium]